MPKRLTLTTIPGEILSNILDMLQDTSPRSLKAFALASKFCKEAVEPTLYRQLSLSGSVKSLNETVCTQRMIHRLLDAYDSLSRHVRNLGISNFDSNGECLNALTLERIIGGLFRLRCFSWDSSVDVPENVISRLEQQWPEVKLIAPNHDRGKNDIRLLSSPLLHSLNFGIYNTIVRVEGPSQLEQYSKLPELREILLNTPNLKKLDIRFKYNRTGPRIEFSGVTAKPHVLNLPILRSDQLPSLHELTLSGPPFSEAYEFGKAHCELLRHCMDWSQLRRLDIGLGCPQHLFEELEGSLSSLKSITMGIRVGSRKYWRCEDGPMTCDNLDTVTNFFEAVPGLHELIITDFNNAADTIATSIIATQRSLHKLSYLSSLYRRGWRRYRKVALGVWKTAQLLHLKHQCPSLSHLEINVPLEGGRWSKAYANILSTFRLLKTLKTVTELDRDASDFSVACDQEQWDVPTPPLNRKLGREVTLSLWKSFFLNDPFARITTLTVCFVRLERYDRFDVTEIEFPIRIKRHERDDASSPLDKGFTLESPRSWHGGWYGPNSAPFIFNQTND